MRLAAHGILALACYAIHAGYYVSRHEWDYALWACHVSCVVIAAGCFLRAAAAVATGLSFLSIGFPLWILHLATGGALLPTTLFTHVGGFLIGVSAIRLLGGWPRDAWWKATTALTALEILCRIVTRPERNVNLVFDVQPGWEKWFPAFPPYFLLLAFVTIMTFLLVEKATLLLTRRGQVP